MDRLVQIIRAESGDKLSRAEFAGVMLQLFEDPRVSDDRQSAKIGVSNPHGADTCLSESMSRSEDK